MRATQRSIPRFFRFKGLSAMNSKPALPLLLLLLCAVLHAPAFAQNGTIHFKGRILAPVCSGTLVAQPPPANASGEQVPVFSLDHSGCENKRGGLIADIRTSAHQPPQAVRTDDARTVLDESAPVWTITYH